MILQEPIRVAFCFDHNFVELFAASLQSLLTSHEQEELEIYLLYEDLVPSSKVSILKMVDSFRAKIFFVRIDASRFNELKTTNHLNKATYYRLSIPDYLPFSKVIYLDSDLLILNSLRDFWNINLDDSNFAAVETTDVWNPKLGVDKLGYCNTGVLLINLNKWRETEFGSQVIEFLQNQFHLTWYADQCAINVIAMGYWKRAPLEFNVTTDVFMFKIRRADGCYSEETIQRVKKNPIIVHFSGPSKPLLTANRHPFKKQFWDFLNQTPFRIKRPKEYTLINRIKFFLSESQRQTIRNLLRRFSLLK